MEVEESVRRQWSISGEEIPISIAMDLESGLD